MAYSRKSYRVSADGIDLGTTTTGSAKIMAENQTVDLDDVDQIYGVIESVQVGWDVGAEATFKEVDKTSLGGKILAGSVYVGVDGAEVFYDLQTVPINSDDRAVVLIFHPTDKADSDFSEDIVIWRAVQKSKVELVGDRTKFQEVPVSWKALPDFNRPREGFTNSATYMRIGSKNAVSSAPDFIGIILGRKNEAPYKHHPASSLDSYGTTQLESYGFWSDDDTVTVNLNDATDVNATDTSWIYDAKSSLGYSLTGKYLKCGTEVLYVVSDTQATDTTGTLVVRRASGYSTAAAHLDNATITLQKNVYAFNVTGRSTWAHSDAIKATVSDSTATKGLVTWVAAGTSNITAAISSTTSKNHVITAVA